MLLDLLPDVLVLVVDGQDLVDLFVAAIHLLLIGRQIGLSGILTQLRLPPTKP